MQDYINDFIEYLVKTRHYSTHTADAYLMDIKDFMRFWTEFAGTEPLVGDMANADTMLFRAWLANRQRRELSFKSTARALSSLRGLFKHMAKYHNINNERMRRL